MDVTAVDVKDSNYGLTDFKVVVNGKRFNSSDSGWALISKSATSIMFEKPGYVSSRSYFLYYRQNHRVHSIYFQTQKAQVLSNKLSLKSFIISNWKNNS